MFFLTILLCLYFTLAFDFAAALILSVILYLIVSLLKLKIFLGFEMKSIAPPSSSAFKVNVAPPP